MLWKKLCKTTLLCEFDSHLKVFCALMHIVWRKHPFLAALVGPKHTRLIENVILQRFDLKRLVSLDNLSS